MANEILANYAGLRVRQLTGVAELQFLSVQSDTLRVTIPLGYLGQLYRDIQRELQKERDLFSLGSKKDLP
jgi:hypothetical protein